MTQPFDTIVSFIDGRIRLRHPAMKQAELMQTVLASLEGVEGVTAVQGNPITGSLLIFYDTEQMPRETILNLVAQGVALLEQSLFGRKKETRDCFSLQKILLGRNSVKMVNRVLVASLLCTLGGIAAGNGAMHKIAGMVFSLACLQHVTVHRRFL